MLKTIKTTKKMRLDELIKYVWDNGITNRKFKGNYFKYVEVYETGKIQVFMKNTPVFSIDKDETFSVEVGEEITKDTKLFGVQEVCMNKEKKEIGIEHWSDGWSINDVLNDHDCSTECLYIYAIIDGKLQLIWEVDEE